MLVKALRPFPYSPDGIRMRQIEKGDEFECRDDIVDGLIAEKHVQPSAKPAKAAKPEQKPELELEHKSGQDSGGGK